MAARSLGELLDQEGILASLRQAVPQIIDHAARQAVTFGKQRHLRVSCSSCDAPKACCTSLVVARLFEGVLIAAQLRDEARDTPELRAELDARAREMEAATACGWRQPCVFLDARERCTVYGSRPVPCGTHHVYSPARACSDGSASLHAYATHAEDYMALQLEEQFRDRLSLRKAVARRYIGVLPRMVLVALEAWDRTDFRDYLQKHALPSEHDAARWMGR